MRRQKLLLVSICLLVAVAGVLLFLSRTDDEVSLNAALEIWADIIRDIDRVGLTMTRVSVKRETEIGLQIEQEIAGYRRPKDDPTLQAYVAEVGQTLVGHIQRRGIRYRFYIVDSPMINAHAISGGGIYITTGMLKILESEAELAAILGHEISHVDLRHCIDRLQYEIAARKIGGSDLAAIARVGYVLAGVAFSEQQELEADAGGAILAAKARYDPRAAVAIFERLTKIKAQRYGEEKARREKPTTMTEELGAALGKALEQYFATHPPMEARVRDLNKVLDRNARAWQGQRFYVGRSNYQDRIPRLHSERQAEWRS